jgi:hypothetical protein
MFSFTHLPLYPRGKSPLDGRLDGPQTDPSSMEKSEIEPQESSQQPVTTLAALSRHFLFIFRQHEFACNYYEIWERVFISISCRFLNTSAYTRISLLFLALTTQCARWNTGITGSNPTRGTDACLRWSPFKESYRLSIRLINSGLIVTGSRSGSVISQGRRRRRKRRRRITQCT